MNLNDGNLLLYCLLPDAGEAAKVINAFQTVYPSARVQTFQDTHQFLEAVADSRNRSSRCCLATSCDFPEATLKKITSAARYWFVPVVLIKNPETPVSVAPFNPIVLVERPLAIQDLEESIGRALELSTQYGKYSSQVERFRLLNEREVNILRLAAVGLPNKSIARRLDVSIKTVEKNRRNAYEKLNITSAAEMASLVTFQKFCRSPPALPTPPAPVNQPAIFGSRGISAT